MDINKALRLGKTPKLALVGAGGKTSIMFQIARTFIGKVVVTTSTHLSVEQAHWGDFHYIPNSIEELRTFLEETPEGIITLTGPIMGERVTGFPDEILSWLGKYCSNQSLPLLIEADGSRQRPLKAPASHEPAISTFVQEVVVMAGLSAIGKPLNLKWVHRPERFALMSGIDIGSLVTPMSIVNVLNHHDGGLKNIPDGARRIVFLSQVDTPELQNVTHDMVPPLLTQYDAVISGYLKTERISNGNHYTSSGFPTKKIITEIHGVHEQVAGIILAAGTAQRYGEPKQLLKWQDKPLVWHVTKKALDAGLRPVIVVSGAYSDLVETGVADLKIKIVYNPDWDRGQSTSVRESVNSLPSKVGAAIFLLADQPQIPVRLIDQLVKAHAETLSPIVVPYVNERLANPVLFDKGLFPSLLKLEGDTGGRQLFGQHDIYHVNWNDPNIFLDVDTPKDYQRLLDMDL